MNMQTKILGVIQSLVEKGGHYEFIQNANSGCTGVVYVQHANSFKTAMSFCYDFQLTYANILLYEDNNEPTGNEKTAFYKYSFKYIESGRIDSLLKQIMMQLPHLSYAKDELVTPLNLFLTRYMESAGTDMNGGIRDIFTELIKLCRLNELNPDIIFDNANEAAEEDDE